MMAAVPALVPLETSAIDKAILSISAPWTNESLRPTSMLESRLALLVGAVELHKLGQRHPWLKLDAVCWHVLTGICILE